MRETDVPSKATKLVDGSHKPEPGSSDVDAARLAVVITY